MTSTTRTLAARIAVRTAARGFAAGNLSPVTMAATAVVCMAAIDADRRAEAERRQRLAVASARTMVQKSRLARMLNGRGDLWNGDDRAYQFALLNAAADARRFTVAFTVRRLGA